jgi:hypothetical protein
MPDWLLQLLGMIGAGVGVYAGIRADLAALRVKVETVCRVADKAHERIDRILDKA